jgi:outer membrane lipoprotein-sorting protein
MASCSLAFALRFRRNALIAITVCPWLALNSLAQAQENAAWGTEQLMSELGQASKGAAHFVERKYMKVLQTPLELSGTLTYEPHGKMVKQTLQPKPETMTIDDDKLVIERRGKQRTMRLQDSPQLWAFVASIRSTLNGDLATLRQFYDLTLDGDSHRWTLVLTPKDSRMRAVIAAIRIGGGSGHIATVEVNETKGDHSLMTIVQDAS